MCRLSSFDWALPVAGGFHSPPGPLTAAALKSKLTSTGAQTRGLLFFYGQNKILKLEVQTQRHSCNFFFPISSLFFPPPNCRESSETRAMMMSSCPRYDGDKPKHTFPRVIRAFSVIVLLPLAAFTPALLDGRHPIFLY